MKTLTKTILTTIVASAMVLFLAACGQKEPATASEAAADAATAMEKTADSDEVQTAQKEAEEAAEETKEVAEGIAK